MSVLAPILEWRLSFLLHRDTAFRGGFWHVAVDDGFKAMRAFDALHTDGAEGLRVEDIARKQRVRQGLRGVRRVEFGLRFEFRNARFELRDLRDDGFDGANVRLHRRRQRSKQFQR